MDNHTTSAVVALLELAEELGIGVAFTPGEDGWTIAHWRVDGPAISVGDLASGYMLEDAASGAVEPLTRLGSGYRSHYGHIASAGS